MSSYRGNLMDIAEAVRQRGRGGDEILVHVNPDEFMQMQELWGEPSYNPYTGLPEYGVFSKLKKALKFEAFNTKKIIKGILKNPERLLVGAVDPLGTEIANKMYGREYDPLVNQLGGAHENTYAEAEAAGLDTGLARDLHNAAGLVAGFYGAQGLGNLAGAGLKSLSAAHPAASGAVGAASPVTGAGSGLGQAASTAGMTAEGLVPISTAAIDTMAAPTVQYSGGALANLGAKAADLGKNAWNYAKQPENWPTIAQGLQTVGGIVGNLVGEDGPPEAPYDPGYTLDINHPSRQFQEGDYSRYYNYGEGPEHSYYTYGPMPEDLTGEAPPVRLAKGGGLGFHYDGLESPLSSTSRYMHGGPGSGRGDEIDAKLSPKEYVFDAETVALLGDGNPDYGAKMLDEMRQRIRKHKGKALAKGKFSPDAKGPEEYL